jgi:2-dehydro-3-deoxygluconokinase
MGTVFCFGELLMRMSPVLNKQWIIKNEMPIYIGGAELNVATALACWELPTKYMTALPNNYLAEEIVADIDLKKIDISSIYYTGERIGVYYLPQGADLKNAGVIYDRAHSAFASLKPGMIDWDKALDGCSWFHFSAISPALNEQVALVCKEGLEAASRKGLTISIDLNYRSKLWQYGKNPVQIMPDLVSYCDVIMGNVWSVQDLLGIHVDADIHANKAKSSYALHANHQSKLLMDQYPKCSIVAYTFRFTEGNTVNYFATLHNRDQHFVSVSFSTDQVVDKVGSGDCFMGGLIYGLYKNNNAQEIINYAAAAAFGKLQELGDATNQSVTKIKSTY